MKKDFILFILCFLFCASSASFAFTSSDVSTANALAKVGLIQGQQVNPKDYRLDDTITRQEIVAVALRKLKTPVPNNYVCKGYFSDVNTSVSTRQWCAIIETAADKGVISRTNKSFRPYDIVTIAEALAIIMKSGELEIFPDIDETDLVTLLPIDGLGASADPTEIKALKKWYNQLAGWQKTIVKNSIHYYVLMVENNGLIVGDILKLNINRPAKRYEVFYFLDRVNKLYFVALGDHCYKGFYSITCRSTELENADPNTFQLLPYDYAKDKNRVYSVGPGMITFSGLDANSFMPLSSWYGEDKNGLYFLDAGDEFKTVVKAFLISGGDKNTFSIIGDPDSGYAKDKNHVYKYGSILENADPKSFTLNNN